DEPIPEPTMQQQQQPPQPAPRNFFLFIALSLLVFLLWSYGKQILFPPAPKTEPDEKPPVAKKEPKPPLAPLDPRAVAGAVGALAGGAQPPLTALAPVEWASTQLAAGDAAANVTSLLAQLSPADANLGSSLRAAADLARTRLPGSKPTPVAKATPTPPQPAQPPPPHPAS